MCPLLGALACFVRDIGLGWNCHNSILHKGPTNQGKYRKACQPIDWYPISAGLTCVFSTAAPCTLILGVEYSILRSQLFLGGDRN